MVVSSCGVEVEVLEKERHLESSLHFMYILDDGFKGGSTPKRFRNGFLVACAYACGNKPPSFSKATCVAL